MQYWRVPEYHKQNWRVPEAVPPLMETHDDGRHMKENKAQTRPARRTPPLRETHEGRQGTDKTREADTTSHKEADTS